MNRLKNHLIYLAGPISADKNIDCMTWRKDMSKFLWSLDIGVLNPCDKPIESDVFHEDETFQDRMLELKKKKNYDELTKIMREIVSIDLHLVDLSTATILYIDKTLHMCGSYTEQAYTCLERKPLIVICEQGKQNIPNWLYGHSKHATFFDTFEEAKEYIRHIHEDSMIDNLGGRWKFLNYNKVYGYE